MDGGGDGVLRCGGDGDAGEAGFHPQHQQEKASHGPTTHQQQRRQHLSSQHIARKCAYYI